MADPERRERQEFCDQCSKLVPGSRVAEYSFAIGGECHQLVLCEGCQDEAIISRHEEVQELALQVLTQQGGEGLFALALLCAEHLDGLGKQASLLRLSHRALQLFDATEREREESRAASKRAGQRMTLGALLEELGAELGKGGEE